MENQPIMAQTETEMVDIPPPRRRHLRQRIADLIFPPPITVRGNEARDRTFCVMCIGVNCVDWANERTYLAWVRTGIAIAGFGMVVARLIGSAFFVAGIILICYGLLIAMFAPYRYALTYIKL